jgi:hypothetical protein
LRKTRVPDAPKSWPKRVRIIPHTGGEGVYANEGGGRTDAGDEKRFGGVFVEAMRDAVESDGQGGGGFGREAAINSR